MTAVYQTLWIIAAALLVTLAAIATVRSGYFDPIPYDNVQIREAFIVDGRLHIVATFEKHGCEQRRFTALGWEAGRTEFMEWRGADGVSDDYDREAGVQTLRGSVSLEDRSLDAVEFRTRHDCDGQIIDRVFAYIAIPYDLTE